MSTEYSPDNKAEEIASNERHAQMSTIASGFEKLSQQIAERNQSGYERFLSDEDLVILTERGSQLRIAAETGNEDMFDALLDDIAKSFSGFARNSQPEGIYDDTDSLSDLKTTLGNIYKGFEGYAGELSGDSLSRKYELILKIHSAHDFMSRLHAAGEKFAGKNPEAAPTMPVVEATKNDPKKAERGETVMSFITAFTKLNAILAQRNREGLTMFFTENTLRTITAELANFETIVNQGNPEEITKSLQNIFALFNQFGQDTQRSGQVRENIQSLQEVETALQSIHNSLGVLFRLYKTETTTPESDPVLNIMNKVGQRISRAKDSVTERRNIARSILSR